MMVHETWPEPALVVYPDPGRAKASLVLLVVMTVVLLGAAGALLAVPSVWVLGIVMLLLALLTGYGVIPAHALWKDAVAGRRPTVRVSAAGIAVFSSATRASFVPWAQVKRFTIRQKNGSDVALQIAVHDRSAVTVPPPATRPAGIGQRSTVSIGVATVPVPLTDLVAEMNAYRPGAAKGAR